MYVVCYIILSSRDKTPEDLGLYSLHTSLDDIGKNFCLRCVEFCFDFNLNLFDLCFKWGHTLGGHLKTVLVSFPSGVCVFLYLPNRFFSIFTTAAGKPGVFWLPSLSSRLRYSSVISGITIYF